ncbi:MAG: GNAT family N-acetyltransferase [Rickettsiales bacterium]|nr:GNAT family N-acetyltransferase [Pseudomonadota bacterium]MDA0966996.1 GNAT family N-acetyltransferase [Pseudomonadota bacterium]MDG4543916.1 GNAT family N-acetyltransferase [Rickettsiales bacterium]MDG4546062.1 GNAT family N-acetyltransferase [Rickettsiales bacterium]MDG4548308.1 GNAT family N-acetyltransferase [Rickettsiales bacterium]
MTTGIIIRQAEEGDMKAIASIYAYYVEKSPATFEEEAPSVLEITRRWRDATDRGLPFLVAGYDNKIRGYAYAFPYRQRSGYRSTVEESVYIEEGYHNKGLGKSLLKGLVAKVKQMNYKQIIAVITLRHGHSEDSVASFGLHQSCGFEKVGHLKKVGWKFNEPMDTIIMQYSVD